MTWTEIACFHGPGLVAPGWRIVPYLRCGAIVGVAGYVLMAADQRHGWARFPGATLAEAREAAEALILAPTPEEVPCSYPT